MFYATIRYPQDQVRVQFDSEHAFIKWLDYLKQHGLASVKMADTDRSVIVFKTNITYIDTDGGAGDLSLG